MINFWLSRTVTLLAGLGLLFGTACNRQSSGELGWPGRGDSIMATPSNPSQGVPEQNQASRPVESSDQDMERVTLWVHPAFPVTPALPTWIVQTELPHRADASLVPGDGTNIAKWLYVLVTPFPRILDGVTLDSLTNHWQGLPAGGPFDGVPLLLSRQTLAALTSLWGDPVSSAIQVLEPDELMQSAWGHSESWAIIPFEQLLPRWKVLDIDDQSPLLPGFELSTFPLVVSFSLSGDAAVIDRLQALNTEDASSPMWPSSNYDANRVTLVAMTGVTALVRATAWTMEQRGIPYPASDIGHWLREADVTHISNEVPFAENCPFPNPTQQGVTFCSDSRYVQLLEEIGTDVVELTGDHFHDWGAEAMLFTLAIYQERGWLTYGGGATYEEGRQPIFIEHNGNRIAFIGCNGKGGSFARASATSPGSVACDYAWMVQTISNLASQGFLVIVTFQHQEHYSYGVPAQMADDFRAVADAGAVIVSGSQAHHPHGFEFRGRSLIHFGLGNLFFDQFDISPGTRQGFIDRHIFYDGRHIGTQLLTYVFVDYARARPTSESAREALLRAVFTASGW